MSKQLNEQHRKYEAKLSMLKQNHQVELKKNLVNGS